MIRRPPRSTRVRSSAASDVYKRQAQQTLGALDCHVLPVDLDLDARRHVDGFSSDPRHASSPHEADDFAADTQTLGLASAHHAARSRDDSHPQAAKDLGQLVLLGIDTTTGLADPLELGDDPAACLLYTSDAADDLTRV